MRRGPPERGLQSERRAPALDPPSDETVDAEDADVIGSTDPSSKDYDPVVISRALRTPPSEILGKEPRDPEFAVPREAALRERLTTRLRKRLPFDVKVEVQCRTSGCDLTLQVPEVTQERMSAVQQAVDLHLLGAEVAQVGPFRGSDQQLSGISITILYPPGLRDHEAYDELLKEHEAMDDPPEP